MNYRNLIIKVCLALCFLAGIFSVCLPIFTIKMPNGDGFDISIILSLGKTNAQIFSKMTWQIIVMIIAFLVCLMLPLTGLVVKNYKARIIFLVLLMLCSLISSLIMEAGYIALSEKYQVTPVVLERGRAIYSPLAEFVTAMLALILLIIENKKTVVVREALITGLS